MGKVETNKKQKNTTLLQTSFELQRELSIYILKINMI